MYVVHDPTAGKPRRLFQPAGLVAGTALAGVRRPTLTEPRGHRRAAAPGLLEHVPDVMTSVTVKKCLILQSCRGGLCLARKASRYLACFDGFARPEEGTGAWPPLPLLIFVSPSAARSERVARWIAEATKGEGARAADSPLEKGIDPGELMLVACLDWIRSDGALGDSCLAALSGERRSVLGAPYARPGQSQFVPDDA